MAWWNFEWLRGKTPEKVIDGVFRGVDKLAFTQQERADLNAKVAESLAQFAKDTMNESGTRSFTRRILCVSVTFVYLLLVIACVVVYKIDPIYSEFIFNVNNECLGTLVLMTFGFYVGSYMVKSYLNPKDYKNGKEKGK